MIIIKAPVYLLVQLKPDTLSRWFTFARRCLSRFEQSGKVSRFTRDDADVSGAFCCMADCCLKERLQRIFAVFDFLQLLDDTLEIFFCFFQTF